MAVTDINIDDLVEDQIDTRAFEAEAAAKAPRKSYRRSDGKFRVRKGEYRMIISKVKVKEQDDGRRFATIIGKLENDEGVYRGTVFADISWQYRENRNGKLDLKSRLCGNLVSALGVPPNTSPSDFVEGIEDEVVRVFVAETFRVPFTDLLDVHAEDREDTGYSHLLFIEDDDEGAVQANAYMDAGYDSRGMVLSIMPLG